MALSVETLFPSPKETMCDKHLWEARDFSRVRLHNRHNPTLPFSFESLVQASNKSFE